MHGNAHRLDSGLLGKIELSRFLTLPLKAYCRFVAQIESSPGFRMLAYHVKWLSIDGALCRDLATEAAPASLQLGEVRRENGDLRFVYDCDAFTREYRFDEPRLEQLHPNRTLAATLSRLRLINSRNRLTHGVIRTLLEIQAGFLTSGDPLSMTPLSLAAMSELLASRGALPMVPDEGRLSRLVRGLSFRSLDGKHYPLRTLFPSRRQLHCHRLDALIKVEKGLLLAGRMGHPWSDEALAMLLRHHYGVCLTRRSVGAIRHHLGIPGQRYRGECRDYLVATEGFSPLLPLTAAGLSAFVPGSPGVYEIRMAMRLKEEKEEGSAVAESTKVIYIGSSIDLRKRLMEHLRGNSGNALLAEFLAQGEAKVRFRMVDSEWRSVERELYRAFCSSFGVPPQCNRMSP